MLRQIIGSAVSHLLMNCWRKKLNRQNPSREHKGIASWICGHEKENERSSLFGFKENLTIVSNIPRKWKNVIMSLVHYDDTIDVRTGDQKKPEIIKMYNLTKTGVDTVDEMCTTYSTAWKSRRWPLTLFFCLLDIAGINAQVIFVSNNPNQNTVCRMFCEMLVKV